MHGIGTWTFWLALGLLAYTYAGFGALVIVWGSLRRRRVRKEDGIHSVSLIVAAYNEEDVIADKLHNCLALDYPREFLEIIVASDGSDDNTEALVAAEAGDCVRLLALPRRGKIHALRDAVARAQGDILVFSDANTMLHANAVRMLVRNFADPEVGGVCGNQVVVKSGSGDSSESGEALYWNNDKWLKSMQTNTGSIVAADGAIYAIRRALFRCPENAAVTDDFAISTAVVQQGTRLVFEPEALAYEKAAGAAEREFSRKVRLMTRGMRGVLLRRALLNPFRYGFYSLILFSHKIVRRLAPVFLIGLALGNLALVTNGAYAWLALLQASFYLLAALGWLLRARALGRLPFLALPFFFCLANVAALVALSKLLRGERIERWEPQRRAAAA